MEILKTLPYSLILFRHTHLLCGCEKCYWITDCAVRPLVKTLAATAMREGGCCGDLEGDSHAPSSVNRPQFPSQPKGGAKRSGGRGLFNLLFWLHETSMKNHAS